MNILTIKNYLDNNNIANTIFNEQLIVYNYHNNNRRNIVKIYEINDMLIFECMDNKTIDINNVYKFINEKLTINSFVVRKPLTSRFCYISDIITNTNFRVTLNHNHKRLLLSIIK